MCMANKQDTLLHCMRLLVTVFNLAIDLFKNPEFLITIVMDSVGIDLFVDFLTWHVFVVEEKVAAEMKGKKGMIYHDGWSKFGVHFVCLISSYMAELSVKGKFESVMTLITVSTLPHHEDDNSKAVAFNAEAHAKNFTAAFNKLGFNKVSDFATGQCGELSYQNLLQSLASLNQPSYSSALSIHMQLITLF